MCVCVCVLVVLFYGVSTLFRVIQRRIKFQTIQFSISIVFACKQLNVKTVQSNIKAVLFRTIQFNLSTQF